MFIFNNGFHVSTVESLFQGESLQIDPCSAEIYLLNSVSSKAVACFEWNSDLGKGTINVQSL